MLCGMGLLCDAELLHPTHMLHRTIEKPMRIMKSDGTKDRRDLGAL